MRSFPIPRNTLRAFVLAGALLALPGIARALFPWGEGGVIVCDTPGIKRNVRTAPDGAGGLYYVWEDLRAGSPRVYSQRLDSLGTRLWNPEGVAVFATTASQIDPLVHVDADGQLVVVARQLRTPPDYCLCAQRLTLAGTALWEPSGRRVCTATGDQSDPSLIGSGPGELVMAWVDRRGGPTTARVYAQRLGVSGRLWGDLARSVSSEGGLQTDPQTAIVGSHPAFVWIQATDLRAQRLNLSSGLPMWGSAGVPLTPFPGPKSLPCLASGEEETLLAAWKEEGAGLLRCQRLGPSGTWMWADGIPFGGDPTAAGLRMTTDDHGGAYFAWSRHLGIDDDVVVQRVDHNGQPLSTGELLLAGGSGDQSNPAIASDGHEGLFAIWEDSRLGGVRAFGQWVDSTGVLVYEENGFQVVNGQLAPGFALASMHPCFAGAFAGVGGMLIGQRLCDWVSNYLVVFDHMPTAADENLVAGVIGNERLGYRCRNVEVICARRVPQSLEDDLEALSGVDSVAFAYRHYHWLDVSTRAIKARASGTYSPNTAEDLGYDGSGVRVAVIDTGVDDNHPSLVGHYVAGFNAITDTEENPDDDNASDSDTTYHGTHCAGTIMGSDNTYRGVAPGAELIDVKVLSGSGGGTQEDVMQGIDWCIEHKNEYDIRVISMSLGSRVPSDGTDPESKLVNAAVDAGIVVVVAAGNSGPLSSRFGAPAAADKAIVVAAMDDQNTVNRADDVIAGFSSRGPRISDNDGDSSDEKKPDVTAPGVNIMAPLGSTGVPMNRYHNLNGTSMATPHVAGVVALMIDRNPYITPAKVKDVLQTTAEDWDTEGCRVDCPGENPNWDRCYGYGYVDAYLAVLAAAGLVRTSICYWVDMDTPRDHGWLGLHFDYDAGSGSFSVWVNNNGLEMTQEGEVSFYRNEPTTTPLFPSDEATSLATFPLPSIPPGDSALVGPVTWAPPAMNSFGQPYFAIGATVDSPLDPIRTRSPMNDNNVATRAHWTVQSGQGQAQTLSFWTRNPTCESCSMVLEIDRAGLPAGWTAELEGLPEGAPVTLAPGEARPATLVVLPASAGTGTAHVEAARWTEGGSQFMADTGGLALTVTAGGSGVLPPAGEARTWTTDLLPVWPQPASGEATLRFTLERAQEARVEVFDLSGRLVARPYQGVGAAGLHAIRWNEAGRLPTGVYWIRLTAGLEARSRRLLSIR